MTLILQAIHSLQLLLRGYCDCFDEHGKIMQMPLASDTGAGGVEL